MLIAWFDFSGCCSYKLPKLGHSPSWHQKAVSSGLQHSAYLRGTSQPLTVSTNFLLRFISSTPSPLYFNEDVTYSPRLVADSILLNKQKKKHVSMGEKIAGFVNSTANYMGGSAQNTVQVLEY